MAVTRIIGHLTRTGYDAVRHPVASASYAAGLVKGAAYSVVRIAAGGDDGRPTWSSATTSPPAPPPTPTPTPGPSPVPGPDPSPDPTPGPTPMPPIPEPAPEPPPPNLAEPAEHEPAATSRRSAHGRVGGEPDIDRWQADAEAELFGEDVEVQTPVGTTGAGRATNPDTTETDLQQPGTEPLMDPATTKAVRSEAEILQRAADVDKG
ncbi:hypothetical protein [Nocardioides terrisoli]|uniref:hypothetical protein n=1 Tax=Nocardioides terrisoli TaxID=3388267 RepID=UPI00287B690B|nr:hypothetical protein [Nocardioides marmorisolisilvae]